MNTDQDSLAPFKAPMTRELLVYWQGLCRADAIPDSAEFIDRVPSRFVPHLMLFDCLADDVLVRFHGSALIARRGADQTGQSWMANNPTLSREATLVNVWTLVRQRCGLLTLAHFVTSTRRHLRVEAFSLPLAVAAGRPPRVVNISLALDTMGYDERAMGWHGPVAAAWVDAGFGVPRDAPLPLS